MAPCLKVGVVATHVEPAKGFGGVAASAARLTRAWGNLASHPISFCASDASTHGKLSRERVKLGGNVHVALYRSCCAPRWGFGPGAILRIFELCRKSDVVYIHGMATWPTTIAALTCMALRRPYLIAPRGGIMPEHVAHIRNSKPWKWAYYRLLSMPSLRRACLLHCTSDLESDGARRLLGGAVRVVTVPNGITLPLGLKDCAPNLAPKDGLALCYVGRIQPEKGVNTFLKLWLSVRRPTDFFLVAGASADDKAADEYMLEFKSLVAGSQGAIRCLGYLLPDEVARVIESSHFLVLPSGLDGDVRENFGNVIAEALSLWRPVMVTKGLAWDVLEGVGAGFVFGREPARVLDAILKAQQVDGQAWSEMTCASRAYAETHLELSVVAEKMWKLLEQAAS